MNSYNKIHIIMYARKYYLLYIEEIFYLNIQEPVSNPSSFYVKSLLTF